MKNSVIPDKFKNCLILTIIDVKGLEFEDVLLWNFFEYKKEDNIKEIWKVLNTLEILYEERECVLSKNKDNTMETLCNFDGIKDINIEKNTIKIKCAKKTSDSKYFLEKTDIEN